MDIILFDTKSRRRLFPLAATKAVADLRTGILTIKERWEKMTGAKVFVLTDTFLRPLYQTPPEGNYIFIDACVIPDAALVARIDLLTLHQSIEDKNGLIAGKAFIQFLPLFDALPTLFQDVLKIPSITRLSSASHIFLLNERMIHADFALLTKGRLSQTFPDSVHAVNVSNIFIEDGATVNFSSLNASAGQIYIGKNAVVMEGCFVRGPFAMCEGAVLKMGAKIYGATTIGPYCTAGGEIKNSVISGYSNKAHEGYLGDSVIGEWCNLGAGTSNSNVKNTGGQINTWNYFDDMFVPSGNKCGVIMGDYSRTAINTSINTGTVIGVCCNIFSEGLSPKFIPDFSWGTKEQKKYEFQKALQDISNWKKMKNKHLSEKEIMILKHIFDHHSV